MEKNNKKFIVKKWKYEYENNAIINISKYFSREEISILKKLGVNIDTRLYTEKEFEKINGILLGYYKYSSNDEIIQTDELTKLGVMKEELNNILNIFNKIALDYKI